ncbi:MAG: hypothetical protein VSS75_029815 [Candidatus Parabeggiatoa sp.]|nr:hypothetical protein [Candidatus Parabeggiatoa sp.]
MSGIRPSVARTVKAAGLNLLERDWVGDSHLWRDLQLEVLLDLRAPVPA